MPYKSAKQRAFMHAQHPDIAARWDKEYGGAVQKGKRRMPTNTTAQGAYSKLLKAAKKSNAKNEATISRMSESPTKMKATVGKKGVNSYRAGVKATSERGSKAELARRAAAVGAAPKMRAVRTTIKAGIRAKHPTLKASKVRARATKQATAMLKKK